MNEPVRNPSKLELCPLCGKPLTIYGPEDWKPSFDDPDSGGDPYNAVCDCGFSFSNGSYDYDKFAAGLNRRAERTGRWVPVVNTWTQDEHEYGATWYKCDQCGRLCETRQPYCHCGAQMIGGDGHD